MKISKRGKDLALRLPASLVRDLQLKSGDQIALEILERNVWVVRRREDSLTPDVVIAAPANSSDV